MRPRWGGAPLCLCRPDDGGATITIWEGRGKAPIFGIAGEASYPLQTGKAGPYDRSMIKSYSSKALEAFAMRGDGSKLPVRNHARVRRILIALDAATEPEDMHLPGFRFHGLSTKPKRYAVDASGNYRVTWAWDDGNAVDVTIEDYH